jgi:hypothetical protein
MNITLRKAGAIQNTINEVIRNINIDISLNLNEFQDPVAELQRANDTLFANDARRQKLLLALYNIRGLVAVANASSGVDQNLTTAAFIDKRVAQLEQLARADVVGDLAVITGKLEKIKARPSDARTSVYGYQDTVTSGVVSREQVDSINTEIKNLKKQKQKINDEVLELNIKTEIPLTDEVVETLTKEGIL